MRIYPPFFKASLLAQLTFKGKRFLRILGKFENMMLIFNRTGRHPGVAGDTLGVVVDILKDLKSSPWLVSRLTP
jgi:hypothetical protein